MQERTTELYQKEDSLRPVSSRLCLTKFVYILVILHSSEKDPFLNRSTKRTFFLLLAGGKILKLD
jgi:hypothetical protein